MPKQILRISQAPPAAAPPPPAAAPPPPPMDMGMGMGAPPMDMGMGAAPMGLPAPGAPAGAPGVPSKLSLYPLENSGMILMDAEIEKRLKEQFASTENINTTSEEEIANEIWIEYGGNKLGGVDKEKVGKRLPDVEVDENEIKNTRDSKWKRLPFGKNLDDLGITLDDIRDMVISLSQGIAAAKKKEAPGGGAPMASLKLDNLIKLAKEYYSDTSKNIFS